MKALSILGRIIFALPFAVFGIYQFMHAKSVAVLVPKYLPVKEGFVYITGLALFLAAVSISINYKAKLSSLLLALLLLIFILTIYLVPVIHKDIKAWETMLRNTSLLGAALTYASLAKN
jgi:putative oxidoreductase